MGRPSVQNFEFLELKFRQYCTEGSGILVKYETDCTVGSGVLVKYETDCTVGSGVLVTVRLTVQWVLVSW